MSCCKKTKPEESGVHLTERTCSPYNPIIKQLVDDCLGLPIYLITSIDAVIDEDGKTLRELLEELKSLVQDDTTLYNQILTIINNIRETIANLENLYLTENSDVIVNLQNNLEALDSLVRRIASMNGESDIEYEGLPYIVYIVNRLREIIEDNNIENIALKLSELEALLVAIAEFDEEFEYNNEIIPIIAKIKSLENWNDTIQSLQSLVNELVEGKADLDKSLLNLNVKKLDSNEYPVTAAKFIWDNSRPGNDGFYYLAKANEVWLSEPNRCDIWPIVTEDSKDQLSWPLFSDAACTTPATNEGKRLYAGNGILDLEDISAINRSLYDDSFKAYGDIPFNTLYINCNGNKKTIFDVNLDGGVSVNDQNAAIDAFLEGSDQRESKFGRSHILEIKNSLWIWHPLIDGKLYVDTLSNNVYRYRASNRTMVPTFNLESSDSVTVVPVNDYDEDEEQIIGKHYELEVNIPDTENIDFVEGDGIEVNDDTAGNTRTITISSKVKEIEVLGNTLTEVNKDENEGTYQIDLPVTDCILKKEDTTENTVEDTAEDNVEDTTLYIKPTSFLVYKYFDSQDIDDTIQNAEEGTDKFPKITYTISLVTLLIDFLLGGGFDAPSSEAIKRKNYTIRARNLIETWNTKYASIYNELSQKSELTQLEQELLNILTDYYNYLKNVLDLTSYEDDTSNSQNSISNDSEESYNIYLIVDYDLYKRTSEEENPDLAYNLTRHIGLNLFKNTLQAGLLGDNPNESLNFPIYIKSYNELSGNLFEEIWNSTQNGVTRFVYKFSASNLSEQDARRALSSLMSVDEDNTTSITDVTMLIDRLLSNNSVVGETNIDTNFQLYKGDRLISLSNDDNKNLIGKIFYAVNAELESEKLWLFNGECMQHVVEEYTLKKEDNTIVLYYGYIPVSLIELESDNKPRFEYNSTEHKVTATYENQPTPQLLVNGAPCSNPYTIPAESRTPGTELFFTAMMADTNGEYSYSNCVGYKVVFSQMSDS